MYGDTVKIVTSLLLLAATIGILRMIVGSPAQSVALLAAGATTISGVTASLEGQPVNG
jgi:hypothetical protein